MHGERNVSQSTVVAVVCAAQFLAQLGAFAVPALLPTFVAEWSLTNTEAGWINGIYYAGYTLAVPILVTLTDRYDPRRIYLLGVGVTTLATAGYAFAAEGFWLGLVCRALMGIGWAGTYMPGLKALSDFVEGPRQSRAVAAHATSVGVSGALSFSIAGALGVWLGWRWALGFGAVAAGAAFLLALFWLPPRAPRTGDGQPAALFDFRPVFRNRSAMAYSIGYLVHTWEMGVLRGWVVSFLTFVAAYHGEQHGLLSPPAVASALGLVGVWASVSGNELAIRFGRRQLILIAMVAAAAMAGGIGFASAISYSVAALLCLVYGALIWSDSSSLTAGSVGSAKPGQRGATIAIHSMFGYFGGFVGPLVTGWTLDLAGGQSVVGWGLAFGHVTVILLVGIAAFFLLRPNPLPGDRAAASGPPPTPAPQSRA